RDQNEILDPIVKRGISHGLGPKDVVEDALKSVGFHEGHMLVRCSVKDHVHSIFPDRANNTLLLGYRSEYRNGCQVFFRGEFHLDFLQREHVSVKKYKTLRTPLGNLPAQFRADRSSRSGNHACATHDYLADEIEIRRARAPAQEFVNLDFVNLTDEIFSGDEV